MSTPTHTLVIIRDKDHLQRLRKYRPVTEDDVRDHYAARITCSNPEACDVWVECPEDGHGDPEDYDYDEAVFHTVAHQWLAGSWCVPSPACAAAICDWDLPDGLDTTRDGSYPVELEWDDWLSVQLIEGGA